MAIFSWDGELECVEAEHDGTKSENGWYKVSLSVAILGHQVVVWKAPDGKSDDLVKNDSSVNEWVEWDSLGSSDGPSEQWVSQHAVNEECWKVPQP